MGILSGITAYHIRVLCENPFEGGGGYTPQEVGDMTLDQIFMRLADCEVLKNRTKKKTSTLEAIHLADKDGNIKGRDKDGNPIVGRIAGVSKAKQLLAKQLEKERLEKKPRRKRKKRL